MGDFDSRSKDVVVTFETLFELLRQEKNKEELQKLDYNFLEEVAAYIKDKRKTFEASQRSLDIFSLEEREKAEKQLQNITKILKELHDRREKKIMQMAINKARLGTNIVDTSNLLAEERALFDNLVTMLDGHRKMMLGTMLSPQVNISEPSVEYRPTNGRHDDSHKIEAKQVDEPLPASSDTKMVRFLMAVPKFVGLDLEIYGPFAEDDMANLPIEMADVLIEKGRAEALQRQEKAV